MDHSEYFSRPMSHSRLSVQEARDDMKNLDVNEKDFRFWRFVADRCDGFVEKANELEWFSELHYAIPNKYLYEAYKDMLRNIRWFDKGWLFRRMLVARIMKLNKHDTANNPDLIKLVDAKGYLTIYHGYSQMNMRNAFWWTLSEDVAKWIGNTKAVFEKTNGFCVVKGKVKPKNIITYLTEWDKEEIIVLNENVKDKQQTFFLLTETKIPV